MARRSAYGRTEVCRLVKTVVTESGRPFRSVYCIMSDGKILRKNGDRWSLVTLTPNATLTSVTDRLLSRGYAMMSETQYKTACRETKAAQSRLEAEMLRDGMIKRYDANGAEYWE
jgi:hypothetical protein